MSNLKDIKLDELLDIEFRNLYSHISTCPKGGRYMTLQVEVLDSEAQLIENILQIMQLVNLNSRNWLNYEFWKKTLPYWFVDFCSPEMTQLENDEWLAHWRTLNESDKRSVEVRKVWSLADWLYWMDPENRVWFYASLTTPTPQKALITIFTFEETPPIGALEWLIKACRGKINGVSLD